MVAIDGTRMQANASQEANRTAEQLAQEILEDAANVDAQEDERFGEARGDELPPALVAPAASCDTRVRRNSFHVVRSLRPLRDSAMTNPPA